ncbi:MAG: glucose-6-phosphate isomerase [Candidatus Omnitrophica bacterium]|nr:glucose-6-phosphate isomerase [Candidatus Omnitrophota bacterium]
MDLKLDCEHLKGFIKEKDWISLAPRVQKAHEQLHQRNGKGHEFTGWLDLPERISDSFLDELTKLGEEVRTQSDCLVSIGIGGSYIGIRASLEFLVDQQKLPVYYAGHNLSSTYYHELLKELENKRVTVVVISKSGTTTEPALGFRIIKNFMEKKYSREELKKRIICVTDEKKGALRQIVQKEGYRAYSIPDDVGGRFSILTPVGLVPLAIAGLDIRGLVNGARQAQRDFSKMDIDQNISYRYAAARFFLYQMYRKIEILSSFDQRMNFVAEWWKQLFGESEGKEGKGIYPASANFTADLHSLGQYIQEGERHLFETFLMAESSGPQVLIPADKENLDNFNAVAGKDFDFVNKQAYKATSMAHFEGDVPNMTISFPRFDASSLGQLYYFFEKAVAITGYLLDVNPFDQPGVEAYKIKMFKLLGIAR